MRYLAVPVIGSPAVMHGDPAERREHPRGVHACPAPFAVHGDERELPRRRRVHPGQLPAHPEPGLVEVDDIGRDQRLADGRQRRAQLPGDPLDHPRDRAGGDRNAEQVADRLAGPAPGQELAVPQVRARCGKARPVPHRGGHPCRSGP